MGNSEVGHNALYVPPRTCATSSHGIAWPTKAKRKQYIHRGSGQIIDQGARLVDIALDNGHAFTGDGWKYISDSFKDKTLHFIGLLSDGGVHSRYNQLTAFLKGAQKDSAKRIRVHILTVRLSLPPP